MKRGLENNLWNDTAPAIPARPATSLPAAVDAAIIGGGFTGCSAALHLAEAGMSVCLFEAETIGYGGSGRNVGLVNAGLWTPPETVERVLGAAAGRRLNNALAAGPDLVFSLIERHAISCEAIRNGTLHCAHSPAGLADLRDRLRQQRAAGAPVELLTRSETAQLTGTRAFYGAVIDQRAGTIQPHTYVRGLAMAAARAGAVIHENTPALSICWDDGAYRIGVPGGAFKTGAVIIATNAYSTHLDLKPEPSFTTLSYFQCATEPLPARMRDAVLPCKHGCWDTARIMTSFRLDGQGRFLLGAIGDPRGIGGAIHTAWARRKLGALYPALKDTPFSHCWSGRIAMTHDHLPRILKIGPGAICIFGYNGRGIAPGTVFGKAAARYVITGDEAALPITPAAVARELFPALKRQTYEIAALAVHAASNRIR